MSDKLDLIMPLPIGDNPYKAAIEFSILTAKLNGVGVRFTIEGVPLRVTGDSDADRVYMKFAFAWACLTNYGELPESFEQPW
jgi:hypothetical protein